MTVNNVLSKKKQKNKTLNVLYGYFAYFSSFLTDYILLQ